MKHKTIQIGKLPLSNSHPFVLFGGLNVLESRDLALKVAEQFKKITAELQVPFVFKASFDKANRSSITSFRGPGLEEGLRIFEEIKTHFELPLITDIHEPNQAKPVAEVVDVLQIPAFLCRQTDLIVATAQTKKVLNIKKAQFLASEDMVHILKKCEQAGNDQVILCERGTSFGYHNLIVDMLGFPVMKATGHPVMFDVTHSLQRPGGLGHAAGGRRQNVLSLALSGMAQGISSLFIEAHPDPNQALCDGPCALPLDQLKPFLAQIKALDDLVKSFPTVEID